jgi:transposase InsO family protein
MVTGMPIFHFEHDSVCRGCALGKNTKKAYPHSRRRANGVLDLIHSNLCGPMTAPSMNGCLYYIIFIDDCSRKTWICFLKTKDESFSKFQEFKNLVENQTGRHIRVLRTNNGKEFDSHKYDDLYRDSGIKRELTVPYNPQQNGVAERKNKTICEADRAMMHDQYHSLSLWAEATNTSVYLQNGCPHKALEEKTPEEVSAGKKPSVDHLRIFGSLVYIHVPKEKRTKLEPSRKKGTFVGYSETSKAYRIYIPGQKYIKVSRNVTFHEEAAFRRSREFPSGAEEQEALASEHSFSEHLNEQREEAREPSMDPIRDSIEIPLEAPPAKRRPAWCQEILKEAKKHAAPKGAFRDSKKPNKYSGLIAQLNHVINSEPSTFDETAKHKVWKDAMVEKYESVLKNDVWEVVPRPKGKSIVTFKWIYKIKHARLDLWLVVSLRKRE